MALENIEYSNRQRGTISNAESNPRKSPDRKVMVTPVTNRGIRNWFVSRKNKNSRIDYAVEGLNNKVLYYQDQVDKYKEKANESSNDGVMSQVYSSRIKKLNHEINFLNNRIKRISSKRKARPIKIRARALSIIMGIWSKIKMLPGIRTITLWKYNHGLEDVAEQEQNINQEIEEGFEGITPQEEVTAMEEAPEVSDVPEIPEISEKNVDESNMDSPEAPLEENEFALDENNDLSEKVEVTEVSEDKEEPVIEESAEFNPDEIAIEETAENDLPSVSSVVEEESERVSDVDKILNETFGSRLQEPIVTPIRMQAPISSENVKENLSNSLDEYLRESSKDFYHDDFSYDDHEEIVEAAATGVNNYKQEQEKIDNLVNERYKEFLPEGVILPIDQENEIKARLRNLVIAEEEANKKKEAVAKAELEAEEARKRTEQAKLNYAQDILSNLDESLKNIDTEKRKFDDSIDEANKIIAEQEAEAEKLEGFSRGGR